jgi:phospholipid transport system substrate-binding protein
MRRPIAVALLLAFSSPASAQAEPARAVVQSLDDGLLMIMKAKGSERARAQSIAPVIDRAFDLSLMTRLAVGPSWTTIAPADQQALVAAFRRMTIAQYASNFDSWSGESFTLAPQVDARAGDRLVRTTLNVPGKEPVAISYRLRSSGTDWKIIDVFYRNSISQIATRRSDFSSILAKEGAKGLVAHLDKLAAKGSF